MCKGVFVSVGVESGHDEDVEGGEEGRDVAVGAVGGEEEVGEVGGRGYGDPFAGVDAGCDKVGAARFGVSVASGGGDAEGLDGPTSCGASHGDEIGGFGEELGQ